MIERGILRVLGAERGAGLAEYALLLALIAFLMVGAVGAFGQVLIGVYNGFGPALFN